MPKTKYANPTNRITSFLNLPPVVLLTNYIFQGLRYMEMGERCYKIVFGVIVFILSYLLGAGPIVSIIISHTANYFLNGQFFVVYRYLFNSSVLTPDKAKSTVEFAQNIGIIFGLRDILYTGSLCRNEMRPSSDIDIRFFRKVGILNAFRAYFAANILRAWGLLRKIPIDVYCFKDMAFLAKLHARETPLHSFGDQTFLKEYPKSKNINNSQVSFL